MYVQHSSVEWRERQLPCASRQEVNDTPAVSVGGPGFNSWTEMLLWYLELCHEPSPFTVILPFGTI